MKLEEVMDEHMKGSKEQTDQDNISSVYSQQNLADSSHNSFH